jgi:hypothetical protein
VIIGGNPQPQCSDWYQFVAVHGHDHLSTVRVTPFLVSAFLADQAKTVLT